MDTNQLRYFEALYQYRRLSPAARSIPISHQGLSKSIASLEEELGVKLFEVGADSERIPTAYADAFLEYAKLLDRGKKELFREFERIETRDKCQISLVVAIGVMDSLGETFSRGFKKKHPDINLSFDELPDWKCEEALLAGQFDLGFTIYPFNNDLENLPLYLSDRLIWVSVDDPLASKDVIELKDLEGYHIGTVGRAFKNYTQLLESAATDNVSFASIETSTQMFWLNDYAKKVKHASFTAPHVAKSFASSSETVSIPIKGFPWGFALSWRKDFIPGNTEEQFIRYCRKHQPQNLD